MLVEAVRLLITLATTAIGFSIGSSWNELFPSSSFDADAAMIWLVMLGAGVGYVFGGVVGRGVARAMEDAPLWFKDASGAQLFAGGFGVVVGIVLGVVLAAPLVALLPPLVGWPLGTLTVLVVAALASRVFASRADDFSMATRTGHSRRGAQIGGAAFLVDSSAAIDARILELARAGLLAGHTMVSAFVIDELQGLADAADDKIRRRGRRGLDVLDALRDTPGVGFEVIEDSVPEFPDVDAKLLALAADLDAALVTTDHNLARAAGLRGVTVVNPHSLAESLRPALTKGDRVTLQIAKEGSEPGQGVGYLDDGTMVVVNGAADNIGQMLEVEIANMLSTNVGRMAFAHPAA